MTVVRLSDEDIDRVAGRVLERLGAALAPATATAAGNGHGHLIDAGQAAEVLGVPVSWIRSETRAGRLPHVPLGKYNRYRVNELQAWADARAEGPVRRAAGSRPVPRGQPSR